MTADTLMRIDSDLIVQNGGSPGNFGVVNRCLAGGPDAHVIAIDITNPTGTETVYLANDGDQMGIGLDQIGSARIYSPDGNYPIFILYLNSTLDVTLTAAPVIGNTSADPVPVTVV